MFKYAESLRFSTPIVFLKQTFQPHLFFCIIKITLVVLPKKINGTVLSDNGEFTLDHSSLVKFVILAYFERFSFLLFFASKKCEYRISRMLSFQRFFSNFEHIIITSAVLSSNLCIESICSGETF